MPKGVTKYQKIWESDLDPNDMLDGKWCKKYDNKNAWCEICKKTNNYLCLAYINNKYIYDLTSDCSIKVFLILILLN